MNKTILILTALYGAIAIILGALGTHALKSHMTTDDLTNYKTAVFYHIIHVLAILIILAYPQLNFSTKSTIGWLFIAGITFFSGSIYLISLHLVKAKTIWFITPFGGLLFILGWLFLTYQFFKLH